MSGSELYGDHLDRMDREFRRDLVVAATNAGFPPIVDPDQRRFCELLAVAARLGELSLRNRHGEGT